MNLSEKASVIIYRIKEKGLEVFLVNAGKENDQWELPSGDVGNQTLVAVVKDDKIISLEPVEEVDGGLLEQAYAVEADWHEIPSLKSILKKDVHYMKNTIKQIVPDVMEKGTFVAVKEAFRRVLPHQYKQIKELKDILVDRNSTTYM